MQLTRPGAVQGTWFPFVDADTKTKRASDAAAPAGSVEEAPDVAEFKIRRIPSDVRREIVRRRFPEAEKVKYTRGGVEKSHDPVKVHLADIDLASYALVDARKAEVPAALVGQGGDEDFSLDGRLTDDIKAKLLTELSDLVSFVLECSHSLEVRHQQKEAELGET